MKWAFGSSRRVLAALGNERDTLQGVDPGECRVSVSHVDTASAPDRGVAQGIRYGLCCLSCKSSGLLLM